MKWDEWRGIDSNNVVFFTKHIIKFSWFQISIHKIIRADENECFHTHPAHAIRIILWGGYVEEVMDDVGSRWLKTWWPGMFGWVKPSLIHRFNAINFKSSYSLWIRFKKVADVQLIGTGWEEFV